MTCNCHLREIAWLKANIKPIGYPQEGPCEHTIISIFVTTLTFLYHIACQEHCLVVAKPGYCSGSVPRAYLQYPVQAILQNKEARRGPPLFPPLFSHICTKVIFFSSSGSKPQCSMCILSVLILRVFSD